MNALVNGCGWFLSQYVPRFPGKGRVVHTCARLLAPLSWQSYAYPTRGAVLRIDLRDRIQRLMWGGMFEPQVTRVVRQFLRPGMVFIDVGAHIGYFAVLAAAQVGPQGAVLAYEADPDNYERLNANLSPYPWARALHMAVCAAEGEVTFYRTPQKEETGWGSLLGGEEHREAVVVPGTTLDHEVVARGLTRVDMVKVDVEGAEVQVLMGSDHLLAEFRPFWLMELNPQCLARGGYSRDDVLRLFREREYRLFHLGQDKGKAIVTLIAIPEERREQTNGIGQWGIPIQPMLMR